MREWIPVPGSVKARLVEAAMKAFCERGYEGVGVTELAAEAGVTTGALYHHFGSKLGLYAVIREELERRIVDRMEGAADAVPDPEASLRAALLVGFDAAMRFGAARLLSEPDPRAGDDAVRAFLARLHAARSRPRARVLAEAWRAALRAVAEGEAEPAEARRALEWLLNPAERQGGTT